MMRGDDGADLQRKLDALGFETGKPDGIFGPDTLVGLLDFQANRRLPKTESRERRSPPSCIVWRWRRASRDGIVCDNSSGSRRCRERSSVSGSTSTPSAGLPKNRKQPGRRREYLPILSRTSAPTPCSREASTLHPTHESGPSGQTVSGSTFVRSLRTSGQRPARGVLFRLRHQPQCGGSQPRQPHRSEARSVGGRPHNSNTQGHEVAGRGHQHRVSRRHDRRTDGTGCHRSLRLRAGARICRRKRALSPEEALVDALKLVEASIGHDELASPLAIADPDLGPEMVRQTVLELDDGRGARRGRYRPPL